MAVMWKNNIRKEVPDTDVSVWTSQGWASTGAAVVITKRVTLKAVIQDLPEDTEDSTITIEKE
tara:strand:+ start:1111 stop:1299 length:189 start_codon:yes stop_codon:yes gene_type:complete